MRVAYGAWIPYSGRDSAILAIVLIVVAAICVYLGTRVKKPIAVRRPGRTVGAYMIFIWLLAIYTFFIAVFAYGHQLREVHLLYRPPRVSVGTFPAALVTFFIILYLTRKYGWVVAMASAFVGAAAAPMIFEFPFDLIVMGRVYPPVPPSPALYRQLFFFPLFMIEFSTVALLTLLPPMRVTRGALFALAAMFAVFAMWAVFGFAFPAAPIPKALNVISKMLCFVTVVLLFVHKEFSPLPRATA